MRESLGRLAEQARKGWEHAASNPPWLEKAAEALGLALLVALTIIFALKPIRTFDPWWHLATGKWIFAHHQVPRVDPFSHTCSGCKWIDLCWLFQVLAYLSYKAGGLKGFWFLKVALVILTMGAFYLFLRRRTANGYSAVLFGLLAVVVVQLRFMARPHLLGFLCLVVFAEAVQLWLEKGKTWALFVSILTYLVWLNSHGSFLVAFAVVGALFLGESPDYLGLHMRELVRQRWLHRHLLLWGLLGITSLLTPYGAEMAAFAITSHLGKGAEATRNIAEWHPMRWKQLFNLVPGTRDSSWGILFFTTAFAVMMGLSLKRERKAAITGAVLLAFSLFLSLKHSRFVAISALLLVPWTATILSRADRKVQATVGAVLVFYLAPLTWKAFELPRLVEDYGRPVASFYPWDLTSFVKSRGIKGNMLNQYAMGGFLIWRLYPNCRVYIDGRTPTVYSPFQFWLYRQIDRAKEVMQSELSRNRIGIALVKRDSKPSRWLWDNSTWCLAAVSDSQALYLANRTAEVAKIPCLKHLKPFASVKSLLKENNTEAVEEELKRLQPMVPHSIYPLVGLSEVYLRRRETKEAIATLKKAISMEPRKASLHFSLGRILESQNRTGEALAELKTVLKLNPKAAPAVKELGILLYTEKRYEEAKRYLKRYLEMVGDADMRTYAILGLAEYELFDVEDALDSFTKAVVLCSKRSLKKELYNFIGNCYWGLKRYKEAILSYKLALKIDPDYQDARENIERISALLAGKAPAQWNPQRSKGLERELK